MRRLALATLLLAAPAFAQKKEVGNLVLDGVPEIPARIVERTQQYQNTRGAILLDWDPTGKGILISTRFADVSQVHLVAAPGADRRQLTFFSEPVNEARFDPQKGATGFLFRMDVGGGEFYQYYWWDRAAGKRTLVTDGKSRNEGILPSNKGGRWAFASTLRDGADFDIYTLDGEEPGAAKLVKEVRGQWDPIDWSRDDSRLLLLQFISINEAYLHVLDPATGKTEEVNPSGGKKISYLAAAFARVPKQNGIYYSSDEDSEFARLTWYDLATKKKDVLTPKLDWDVEHVAVSADGKWLAYTANEGGTSALYLAPTAAPKKPKKIGVPTGVIANLLFDRQSKRLGLTISAATSTADVYSVDLLTGKPTRWTTSEVGGLDAGAFASPELITYKSFDGKEIPAWYYAPKGGTKPFPVIISIHGGPEAQALAAFSPQVQYWVNELGAAVLAPNVRGSTGYGKSYVLLDNGEKREDSVKDIGALLDWIGTRPELDPGKVAVIGGSYGGFMVLASMAMYGERIRCGVEAVGISNFVTFLQKTEDYRRDLRRAEYGDERVPAMRDFLLRISPTTNAAKIKAPLLVAQGLNDPRVPANEAEQIVKTVRKASGKVWYVLAKDEGHGFQKKVNRDFYNNAVSLFFEEFLLK